MVMFHGKLLVYGRGCALCTGVSQTGRYPLDEGYGGGMAGMGHTSARGSESPVATAHSAVARGKMVVLTYT